MAPTRLVQLDSDEVLNEDERLVRGWGSVEIVDADGQLVPISLIVKNLNDFIAKNPGAEIPISDLDHSDRIIGGVKKFWEAEHPKLKVNGLMLDYKVYKGQPYYDEAWKQIKSGQRRGLSWSGGYSDDKTKLVEVKGTPAQMLGGLQTFAFASCVHPKNEASQNVAVNFKAASGDAEFDKAVQEEMAKQKIEHPNLPDEYLRMISEDHVKLGGGKSSDVVKAAFVQKPFADYKDFADCVSRNKDKGDPAAYCAVIMRQVEGKSSVNESAGGMSVGELSKDNAASSAKKGVEMEPGTIPAAPSPQGSAPAQGPEGKLDRILALLEKLVGQEAGEAEKCGVMKAEEGKGEGYGSKQKLPESVGEETTNEPKESKEAPSKVQLSEDALKAMKSEITAEIMSSLATKASTPRPETKVPDMPGGSMKPAKKSLGYAYEVATGKKTLNYREIEAAQREANDAAVKARLEEFRARAE